MKRTMFKSKIHRATITSADLNYEGSITIDSSLLKAADILPYEMVHVWNISNGHRLVTYALAGKPDSGEICVNGAGAKLCGVGDLIIIATFTELTGKKARDWMPKVILVDNKNHIVKFAIDVETAEIKPGKMMPTEPNYLMRPIGTNSTGIG
ncbi:aspartate 1-decarboxylase [Candidatus Pacearchaeota archaeon]|nr:aspartate 1-decarboxylase [Candidatus Pacearchaeota archaeon]